MALETGVVYISDLVAANPTANDPRSQGDDHLRGIKVAVKGSIPGLDLRQLTGLTGSDEGKVLAIDSAGLIEAASVGETIEVDDSYNLTANDGYMSFDLGSEVSDDHNLWDNANPTRFTMPGNGRKFLCSISGAYSSHTDGVDTIILSTRINAGTAIQLLSIPIFSTSGVIPETYFFVSNLANTDYFEIGLKLLQIDTADTAVVLTSVKASIRRFY